jgi:hypothetical protein
MKNVSCVAATRRSTRGYPLIESAHDGWPAVDLGTRLCMIGIPLPRSPHVVVAFSQYSLLVGQSVVISVFARGETGSYIDFDFIPSPFVPVSSGF